MSATLKNVYAPVPSVTRSKPVHFGAHPKGTHFIYASARNIVIRNVTVRWVVFFSFALEKSFFFNLFFFFFFFFFSWLTLKTRCLRRTTESAGQ
jgi:hypothetical protein